MQGPEMRNKTQFEKKKKIHNQVTEAFSSRWSSRNQIRSQLFQSSYFLTPSQSSPRRARKSIIKAQFISSSTGCVSTYSPGASALRSRAAAHVDVFVLTLDWTVLVAVDRHVKTWAPISTWEVANTPAASLPRAPYNCGRTPSVA